ncbi:MAG TPA: 2-C-methyl-D-erythritol 2,4-cyclodiphosphate synthase [Candidatus Kapabacteria bacterium]|jgi:2-C-methyl-D-erythritol 2,4-cyclodiphosphate synthase|nr:2-C-methyl-D-erythritol 2,4-cyclodiphosphate synthase [Candidatus Kapabacteria bacterium]HOM05174.1 2-C-methyl-D-erythritol 2,4-cyclodiphosphate synthase [Candidatus Kapabacteria bacterium]HOQ49979.1 2-C-methyl-D-erythritol 2,4-cyclodiphosphate synthase [Candidatus Kapabacteria bacterium]
MVGIGYDIHKLKQGETLILGGVQFDEEYGTVAHSDGDVLLHAIMDAILGAASLGDIGEHFPDNDEHFRNISSLELLKNVISIIDEKYVIVNIDATLICEKPKIKDFKLKMRENIANACNISINQINIKATTNEKLGAIGRAEGIAAIAICQLEKKY